MKPFNVLKQGVMITLLALGMVMLSSCLSAPFSHTQKTTITPSPLFERPVARSPYSGSFDRVNGFYIQSQSTRGTIVPGRNMPQPQQQPTNVSQNVLKAQKSQFSNRSEAVAGQEEAQDASARYRKAATEKAQFEHNIRYYGSNQGPGGTYNQKHHP